MSINKDFYVPRRKINWHGEDVCEIRGITPNDIALIVQENAADMESIMEVWAKDKSMTRIASSEDASAEIATALTDNAEAIFNQMILLVPNLAAKIIATAGDEPASAEHIRDNFVAPLQFDILCNIAEMTFINRDGFKKFVGNVLALVENVSGASQRRMVPQEP